MFLPRPRPAALLGIALLLSETTGCDRQKRARLTGVPDEQAANQIIAVLERVTGSMQISKEPLKKGAEWVVIVPADLLQHARAVIEAYGLPRRPRVSLGSYPAAQGMFPTPAEERARSLAALGGNIETALLAIDRVVDVQVTVNLPEPENARPADRPQPSASVLVKYVATMTGEGVEASPISESATRALVAASVPALTPERVNVTFAPVALRLPGSLTIAPEPAAADSLVQPLLQTGVAVLGIAVIGLIVHICRIDGKLRRTRRAMAAEPGAL